MSSQSNTSQDLRRVLILDDEQAVISVLTDYLQTNGLEIITVQELEGAEALLSAYRFDVVITDLRVSELGGLEGVRLIRYVRTHYPDTTVLAMSGFVTPDVRAMAERAGVHDILEKPIDLRKLRAYVCDGLEDDRALPECSVIHVDLIENVLKKQQIKVVVQPIVQSQTVGEHFHVFAVETLARGPNGTPFANPEVLFSYASRKELLVQTDLQCIEASFQVAQTLPKNVLVFINIEPRSLTHPDFADLVMDLLNSFALEAGQIVFEVTEQESILNVEAFKKTLALLRGYGFLFALDDYGEGVSNLDLLVRLKPDFLKISGQFAMHLHDREDLKIIVDSTASMARRLSIPTILEGVEYAQDLEELSKLGVTYAQGYFIARPAPVQDFLGNRQFSGL